MASPLVAVVYSEHSGYCNDGVYALNVVAFAEVDSKPLIRLKVYFVPEDWFKTAYMANL
jgi:hypothetical protein